MNRALRWIMWLTASVAVLFVLLSWGYAQRLTGPRQRPVGAPPRDFPFSIEAVSFGTIDGETLAGWFIPGENSQNAIILLHGFAGERTSMLPRARFFRQQGYAVLLYDARACGESTGQQVSFGYRERHDLTAAVQFLKERGHEQIACLGVSQGGATVLFAADELADVRCVICESVYDEMTHAVDRRMRRYTGLPGWLAGALLVPCAEHRLGLSIDAIKPVEYIAALRCPVFIISGDRDNRTWPEDTQRLIAAAREPKELWMIEGAGHEDLFRYPGYEDRVRAFLRKHLEQSTERVP